MGSTYRVVDLAARDALDVQQGDLVKVADTGNGRHDAFLYANGAWIRQIRGGDAGEIVLDVDELHLSADSAISTASVSGGGGSIKINAQSLAVLNNSQITTSVQEGVGNGGDLNINANFLVQNQAPITARAVEGNGGNINIQSKGIYQIGGAAANPIDASSAFGVSGEVKVQTPENNLEGSTFIVSGKFIQSRSAQPEKCDPINNLEQLQQISRIKIDTQPEGNMRNREWLQ